MHLATIAWLIMKCTNIVVAKPKGRAPLPNVYFMLPLKLKISIYSNRTVGTLGLTEI